MLEAPQEGQTHHGAAVESRRQTSSPTIASTLPTGMNTDDSIVLSDLVRSGEASRLRRRGALRLDRNSLASGQVHHRHLSFESDFESDDASSWTSRPHTRWLSAGTEHANESEDDDEYILVCGAEVEGQSYEYYSRPFEPSILPIDYDKRPRRRSYTRPTNGCGALVHLSASPSPNCSRGPGKTYIARGSAADSVVSLGLEYFDAFPGVKFERNSCGCVKEGVGCAICGNPLGMRWRFCKAMAASQRQAPRRYGQDSGELFTFFATAVTAQKEERRFKPTSSAAPTATLSAKPSQEWTSNPPQYPPNDWLGTLSNHYDTPAALAINVEVTSSISYSDSRHSLPDLGASSTTSTVEAELSPTDQRPPLIATQSAPAAMFAYHLTDSPESVSQSLPDDDILGPSIVRRDASDSSSSASSSSVESYGVLPVPSGSNPTIHPLDASDESAYAYPGMSLFEQQVGSGALNQGWVGGWFATPSSSEARAVPPIHLDGDDYEDEESNVEDLPHRVVGNVLFGR